MQCVITGCQNPAPNSLGVRLRVPGGKAIWAPETGAHICDVHAVCGMKVSIVLELTDNAEIETTAQSVGAPVSRTMRITHTP